MSDRRAVGSPTLPGTRAALVVAHPGHELRVYGWLERARPVVCVLTDGSSHAGRSRLASTTRVVDGAGALRGEIYGAFTDRAVYEAILAGDVAPFAAAAHRLAATFVEHAADYVVGDAFEGYNPGHDLCRVLIDAAVALASRAGRTMRNFDFPLTGRPDACPPERRTGAIALSLDDDAFRRKLDATHAYPELADEAAGAVAKVGLEAFRLECLRPVGGGPHRLADEPPFYERYGAHQVARGHYPTLLRYGAHFVPLVEALSRALEVEC